MRLGLWCPLPHVIRPEPEISRALDELGAPGAGLSVDRSFAFALAAVQRAEALGFDLTLIAERFVARDLAAWVVSSALAALTSKIEIMTAAHPGIIPPQVVAKMGSSLDRLSGGRFLVNIVPGNRPEEFNLYGNRAWMEDQDRRYQRMQEYIEVLKAMWRGEPFDFSGEFYRVEQGQMAQRPLRVPVPIYAAANGARGKEIIARECDFYFCSHPPGLANWESNCNKVAQDIAEMQIMAAQHNRTLGFGVSTQVLCAPTDAQAEELAADLERQSGSNVAARALGVGLVGSPQRIAQRIRRWEEAGITCLMLQFHPTMDGLETFAREVMPLLR
jgi:FMNH2-dependent dimethyl sulfone monooxygenase